MVKQPFIIGLWAKKSYFYQQTEALFFDYKEFKTIEKWPKK